MSHTTKRKRMWVVLSMLSLVLAASLGLFASGGASANVPAGLPASTADSPAAQKDAPFSCAQITALGIDKQMNSHAAQLLAQCGKAAGGKAAGDAPSNKLSGNLGTLSKKFFTPLVYGGPDANVVLPDGTYPKVTQSESFVWGNGLTVVVNYNDSRTAGGCYAGLSYSLDGGTTWTRPGGTGSSPLCAGHGTNFGDPTVVYNTRYTKWYATDLASGCGGQGLGAWTSPDGITWAAGPCVHSNSQDDRNSFWVDNNAASPFYGNMYESYNDFNVGGGALYVTRSTDGGLTWLAPVQVAPGTPFIRDVQITGAQDASGTVILAGMNEGGGGLANRMNLMYRSTDGGATFPLTYTSPAFYPPGRAVSGYFAGMYPGGYWRHMGWGQPGVGPSGTVHYVYAMGISGTDAGNIMYIRSTDNGVTFSAPLQLNTDTTTRAQWMPSLAVTQGGALLATWYDERDTASCGTQGSTTPCYRRFGRVSLNNGVTWQADDAVSDTVSPLPGQPDSTVQTLYAGDYDYSSANGTTAYTTWTDGRVIISGASQQDVNFDRVPLIQGTPTPTATPCSPVPCTSTPTNTATRTSTPTNTPSPTATVCGQYSTSAATGSVTPGTTNIGSSCDDCVTSITFPFPVQMYNNETYTSAGADSNGRLLFTSTTSTFTNACLPNPADGPTIYPHWDDLRTDVTTCTGGCGIYTSTTGSAPNRVFHIEWRAGYFSGTGNVDFEVRLHEGSPNFEVVYGLVSQSGTSATVGVQDATGARFTQFECNTGGLSAGMQINFTFAGCGPTFTPTRTSTPGGPTFTPTRTATPGGTPCVVDGTWSTQAPYPITILDNAAASVGGFVYSFSGVSGGLLVPNSYKYDPTANTWTPIAPLPAAREQASAVSDGTNIYIMGGADSAGADTNTLYRYNVASNTYDTLAPSTTASWAQAAAYLNGKVYRIGGCVTGCSGSLSTVEVYTISTNTWASAAPLPAAAGWLMAVGYNGYVWVAGGTVPADSLKTYRYDTAANTWDDASIADLPGTRWGSASDIVGGKWLLAGGYAGAAPSNTNVAYNFATNTWDTPPTLPIAKARWSGGTAGTRFAAPGGRGAAGGFTGTNETQVYTVPPCGTATPTVTGTPPTNTPTFTPTCASGYAVTTGTATIVAGTTNTGSACDDCVTSITLPFPFSLYGTSYTSAGADSNGRLLFTGTTSTFTNSCLPSPADGPAIFPHWDDLRTDVTTCTGGCGIYTSVSGSAPNRIFNIEWRAGYFSGTGNVDFEIRLYEGGVSHFDVVYGQVDQSGTSATVGVQDPTGTNFTQFECNTGGLSAGMLLSFVQGTCGTPGTNTPTPTQGINTNTPTRTATGVTNTNTPTRTNTPGTPGITNTATRTNTPGTPGITTTPSLTPTCVPPTFSDVHPTDYFYTAVNWLYCEGAITGYSDGTFRPYNNTTRGQLTKIIVIARHWPIDLTGAPHFTDVDSSNVFYAFIETAYNRNIISGYADGTFRPFANVTRGQLSKIIVQAMGWDIDTTGGPHFTDVPTTNPFYDFIETAYNHNIIAGYSDGTFRWANDATRGQISVIVYRAAAP